MSNQEDQINLLNAVAKMRIAPSPIHGVGVFATRDLKKGEKLYSAMFPKAFKIPFGSFGKLFPEVKRLILERNPLIVGGGAFMWPDVCHQAYLNHSDTPNIDAVLDYALEDIPAGTELTEDYRKIEGWEVAHPYLVK